MVLKLHYDLLSQPSRALFMLLKMSGAEFEPVAVSIMNGEHQKPEYKAINPLQKVPVIQDGDFTLTESVAQLRYIAASQKKVADHWYPKDAKKQARVDEFLSWHHTGLRKPCLEYFLPKLCSKVEFGGPTVPLDADKEKELTGKVEAAMKTIEEYFLKGKKFIVGDEISAADLIGYNELKQMMAVGREDLYNSNKTVGAWMNRVEEQLGGLKEEISATLKVVKSMYDGAK